MKKKNILITGADGFIGKAICSYLQKRKINYKKIKIDEIGRIHKNISHLLHLQFFISKKNNKNFQKKILR